MIKKIAIIGKGGFAKELTTYINDCNTPFKKPLEYFTTIENDNSGAKPIQELIDNIENYVVYIGIGNGQVRKRIVEDILPINTNYGTMIHPTAYLGSNIQVGEGSVICPNCVITTDIKIGKHVQLNIQTSVGHDSVLKDYVTTAPKVSISGNNHIGESVYLGTSCSTKEKVYIKKDSVLGLNSAVVKNINESGVYVGIPCKKIK